MSDIDKAKSLAQKHLENAQEALEDTLEHSKETVDEWKRKGSKYINKSAAQAGDLLEEAQEITESAVQQITKLVRKNPGAAIALGLTAVAILYLFRGKKENQQ